MGSAAAASSSEISARRGSAHLAYDPTRMAPQVALQVELGGADNRWKRYGACNVPGVDRKIFFPSDGNHANIEAAKLYCCRCPVRVRCLEHALKYREDWGIWGGTTWTERETILRRRRRAHLGIVTT